MNEKIQAFWLGLFIIIAVGLTAWLILFLKPSLGDGKVLLTVHFSNIDKVSKGTLITFGGRQVGEVKEIKEVADPRKAPADAFGNLYIYELTLQVDSRVKVYVYDEIIYATSGLLGEKSIAIIPKAPPPGAPAAYEVSHEILYARSTDKFEQTLNKFVNVADTLQNTLNEVNIFIETNNKEFNIALKTLSGAAEHVQTFMSHIQATDVITNAALTLAKADDFFTSVQHNQLLEGVCNSFDSLNDAATLFYCGEGTIAQLANSDCLYVQLNAVLCQLQTVLSDIRNYGLFYQFDRKWQRMKNLRRHCTEIPDGPYCEN